MRFIFERAVEYALILRETPAERENGGRRVPRALSVGKPTEGENTEPIGPSPLEKKANCNF